MSDETKQAAQVVTVGVLRDLAGKANERAERERACRSCGIAFVHQVRATLLDDLAAEYRTRALHILNSITVDGAP